MSIADFIQKYRKKKRILFTTPSHSQGDFIVSENKKMLGEKFFSCDYSEIEGFDNLSNPIGIIRNAQETISEIYNSKASFFLINGSTSGIITAMFSILSKNDKVIIARNCHKSIYNGLVLTGAFPIWFMPDYNPDWGIYDNLNINTLEELIIKNKDTKALIITNPTYEGIIFDIEKISLLCKKYGIFLIVDEAHGALWNYNKSLGTPAILQGADITVQSLHKTTGALNPSAILHISKDSSLDPKTVKQALNLFTTTSPSYPLLLNIESTVNFLSSKKGQKFIENYIENIKDFINSLKDIPNLEIYSKNNDITKILVKVTNLSGFELSNIMIDKYGIEDELSNEKSTLYLTGIGTTSSKLKKLKKALINLSGNNIKISKEKSKYEQLANIEPKMRYTPSEVWGKKSKEIDLNHAMARVSMEISIDYPPGVPILLPGEVIKREHINYLCETRKKIKVLA